MASRRLLILSLAALAAVTLGWLLLQVLAPGGWTVAKLVMLASFCATAPWTGLCVANAMVGFWRGHAALAPAPSNPATAIASAYGATVGPGHSATALAIRTPVAVPRQAQRTEPGRTATLPRTAIALTVRDEDLSQILPSLRRLLDELDAAGVGDAFALCILSDTAGPDAAHAEADVVALFRATDRDPARIRYRRRTHNAGFKAGNVMDFLDHHADGFELMLTLDADSRMSAAAVLRLVRAMQADPTLGIVQHLTVGLPAASAFPRLFQFGMRAGMRIWAAGQDWWQGDEGPYWGHNALVRIAPFRVHCRLPLLPGGRHILSHDQVEAAMLRGAGWGVRVLAEEDGSAEANPPALPEHLRRECRWLAGNLQYRHLLRLPGLRPMGRWQLIQAILLFAGMPFYLLFLCAAAWAAATDTTSPFPAAPALALSLAWPAMLYAPKLLGYAAVLGDPTQRARYGGGARFAAGAVAEFAFSLLLDAVMVLAKTGAMLRLACGAPARWLPQNRNDRGVSWGEATRLCWPQTLLGVLLFAAFATAGWRCALWAAPFIAGLPLAIPFCVLTADPRVGRWLRRRELAAIPEELPPPRAPRPWPILVRPQPALSDVGDD